MMAAECVEDVNIWTCILEGARQTGRKASGIVIIIGENESGRSSLVRQWQHEPDASDQFGIEFHYVDVKDEDGDDVASLSVWTLDGEGKCACLLNDALSSSDTLIKSTRSMILIVVRMEKPWNILDSLKNALDIVDQFNFGSIPVMAVVSKVDLIEQIKKENDYCDEHFDFIQYHLRKFALERNVGLCYTSIRNTDNQLLKYISHYVTSGRLDDFDANFINQDALFIPIGMDDPDKIDMLRKAMPRFGDELSFNQVIFDISLSPTNNTTSWLTRSSAKVIAENEQKFLARLYAQLNKLNAKTSNDPSEEQHIISPSPSSKSSPIRIDPLSPSATSTGSQSGPTNHTLKHFFSTLLNKKAAETRKSTPNTTQNTDVSPKRPTSEPIYSENSTNPNENT